MPGAEGQTGGARARRIARDESAGKRLGVRAAATSDCASQPEKMTADLLPGADLHGIRLSRRANDKPGVNRNGGCVKRLLHLLMIAALWVPAVGASWVKANPLSGSP